MKNCNNCSTINIDTATRCENCNMEGDFTFHSLPIKKTKSAHQEHCQNCGTMERGEGTKCIQCNFPIERATEKVSLKNNFRTA